VLSEEIEIVDLYGALHLVKTSILDFAVSSVGHIDRQPHILRQQAVVAFVVLFPSFIADRIQLGQP